ncbi:hypothetical protein [Streptomyces sp. H39-S7]|uniref:hypothetical protein n=1 Tax=Streptomyces sp. H39-S7 TaxID=3004357 RepID=UPI0022AF001D|nr:hypothetical protein [Streptomyces sp. H39-S7]MCZ4120345.1 hypothetical protein [Streptomyces sp. H39-S7]
MFAERGVDEVTTRQIADKVPSAPIRCSCTPRPRARSCCSSRTPCTPKPGARPADAESPPAAPGAVMAIVRPVVACKPGPCRQGARLPVRDGLR